ncbi:MAG: RdgB/HAM1 family non-canonical purine NTP pyrophosphatase [Methylococcales bacterium]|jgi:XTP/dITP diphosphohydrolase|nr:RdgB/HAM1 family non-canonical purine NTP pyrophosphatase [Methylococcales bacterium]MBT7445651.1 RdgB/HAM1 family non-canonical purine NTP pyrophosphatase [Methylococcales bacterium]
MDNKIVMASNNKGKLKEFAELLSDFCITVVPQSEFDIEDAVEDGLSFVENAIIKARHASKLSGRPAIADDSGIEVDALNGAPGIYSARYSGEGAADDANWKKLLKAMEGVPAEKRSCRYQCLLVFVRHAEDPTPLICQGTWEGVVLEAPQGDGGFGYDPIFGVLTTNKSAAELTSDEKHARSHRGQALQYLVQQLNAHRHFD